MPAWSPGPPLARAVAGSDGVEVAGAHLVEVVVEAWRVASCCCRDASCRWRSLSFAARAGLEARSATEAWSLISSALQRTDLSCSFCFSARTMSNCMSMRMRRCVSEALSSSKSMESPGWRLAAGLVHQDLST